MGALRARVLGAALVLVSVGLGATPAHADGGEFSCEMSLNLAAGSGVTHCSGTATGVVNGVPGTYVADAVIGYNALNCPLLFTGSGTIRMDGIYYADVSATVVGSAFVATLSNSHSGSAFGVVTSDAVGPGACADTNVSVTVRGVFAAT